MRLSVLVLLLVLVRGNASDLPPGDTGWPTYGGDPGGDRYSILRDINTDNVSRLQVAWTYHTGALQPETALNGKAAFEATPILVGRTLYLSTPFNQVIALDAKTGAEQWKFDPDVDRSRNYSEVTSRGVAAWVDQKLPEAAPCRIRIFEGTIDARLLALDGRTGKPCGDFGNNGKLNLAEGVDLVVSRRWMDYEITAPPTVVGDLVITGSSIGDNRGVQLERGMVRAFDVRTGKLCWTWDPIPWAQKQNPRTGAGNAWTVFAADPARDLVFVPTGSASPDFYGGLRPGDDRYADSVTALRASTGQIVWSFQVVHHNLWDYDVASQPTLITFKGHAALAVTSKQANLFILDRETGKPLNEIVERAVPPSDIPGEQASPTQPFTTWSAMTPQKLSEGDMWGPTPEARKWCEDRLHALRNDGLFTPPSLKGSVAFPGNIGGVNWGGAAWDPQSGLLFANTNRLASVIQLIPRDELVSAREKGEHNRIKGEFGEQRGTPFAMYREWLLSPAGTPCNAPPWGALVAYDLKTGSIRWQTALGEMKPGMNTGSPNLGGPIVTAGGLVFSAGAMDTFFRAFDVKTGKEAWRSALPASAQSTPMTYSIDGKQVVVICAGGHGKLGTKMGDAVVAYALR